MLVGIQTRLFGIHIANINHAAIRICIAKVSGCVTHHSGTFARIVRKCWRCAQPSGLIRPTFLLGQAFPIVDHDKIVLALVVSRWIRGDTIAPSSTIHTVVAKRTKRAIRTEPTVIARSILCVHTTIIALALITIFRTLTAVV